MNRASRAVVAAFALVVVGVVAVAVSRGIARRDTVHVCGAEVAPRALLVFVTERVALWRREPARDLCATMSNHGIATLFVRLPPMSGTVEARAESLASNLSRFTRSRPHTDTPRIVLGGHGAAAEVVAALALGNGLAARAGLDPSKVAGVLALGGRFGGPPASNNRAGGGLPVFLLLAGALDASAAAQQSRRFAKTIEASGATRAAFVTVPERDAESIANLSGANLLTRGVVAFICGDSVPGDLDRRWSAAPDRALAIPLSTEAFGADSSLVRTYPVTLRLRGVLRFVLGNAADELQAYDLAQYRAVDLLEFLASKSERDVGTGDHLVATNLRGERTFLTREELQRLRPQVVVGLDDEANLFRLQAAYRQRLRYSWIPDSPPPPWMARPVGGLLYFPDSLPRRFPGALMAATGLTPSSFRWQRTDPLEKVRNVPDHLQTLLVGSAGCLHCHSFRGVGAASSHSRQDNLNARVGGTALALERYPPEVVHAFLFDQNRVAAMFGVRPLAVVPNFASELETLIGAERTRR